MLGSVVITNAKTLKMKTQITNTPMKSSYILNMLINEKTLLSSEGWASMVISNIGKYVSKHVSCPTYIAGEIEKG